MMFRLKNSVALQLPQQLLLLRGDIPGLVVKVCISEAHHVRDAVAEHGGLSAAGAGDYQDCALYLEHCLSLHFVGPGEKAGERIAL